MQYITDAYLNYVMKTFEQFPWEVFQRYFQLLTLYGVFNLVVSYYNELTVNLNKTSIVERYGQMGKDPRLTSQGCGFKSKKGLLIVYAFFVQEIVFYFILLILQRGMVKFLRLADSWFKVMGSNLSRTVSCMHF